MLTTQVLLDGVFQPADIALELSIESRFGVPENLQEQVNTLWNDAVKEAEAKGLALWDSESYRLLACRQSSTGAHIEVGTISYKDNLGVSKLVRDGELGEEYATQLMYCSLIVRTKDDKYLFGGGGPHHSWQGETKCIGGSYNTSEQVLTSSHDLFAHALHELQEETNIAADTVHNLCLRKVMRTTRGLAALIFTAETTLTSIETRERFSRVVHKEFAELLCLTPDETREFFKEKGRHFLEMLDLIVS